MDSLKKDNQMLIIMVLVIDNYYPRLRDLREDHDRSQQQIAEYVGMKQLQYSRYERGEEISRWMYEYDWRGYTSHPWTIFRG